jgi:hypothetical protein
VKKLCLGKSSCQVDDTTKQFGDPCYGTVKWMYIQARCSNGGWAGWHHQSIYLQGFINSGDGHRRLLVVNKRNEAINIQVSGVTGGTIYTVDEATHDTPPRSTKVTSDILSLSPWAVSVIVLS